MSTKDKLLKLPYYCLVLEKNLLKFVVPWDQIYPI